MNNRILFFVSPVTGRTYPIHREDFSADSAHVALFTLSSGESRVCNDRDYVAREFTGWEGAQS